MLSYREIEGGREREGGREGVRERQRESARETERVQTHKTKNPIMFVINYLSLNTKSGYMDFRSLSFLIDRALSFAVLLILITLLGVKFSRKYNVFTGLKSNLLLSKLCKSIFLSRA